MIPEEVRCGRCDIELTERRVHLELNIRKNLVPLCGRCEAVVRGEQLKFDMET